MQLNKQSKKEKKLLQIYTLLASNLKKGTFMYLAIYWKYLNYQSKNLKKNYIRIPNSDHTDEQIVEAMRKK